MRLDLLWRQGFFMPGIALRASTRTSCDAARSNGHRGAAMSNDCYSPFVFFVDRCIARATAFHEPKRNGIAKWARYV